MPVEATAGPAGGPGTTTGTGTPITAVNKAGGYFIAGTPGRTFFYDGNDQFRINNRPVTLATFAASLSTGDALLSSTYADDPDLQSTFDLDDLTPTAVAGVTAAPVDDTSIKVTWNASGTAPQSYSIYRKASTAQTDTLADYTKIADVPGSTTPTEYVDKGLTASTSYTYAVTQTVDGDESAITAATPANNTDSVDTAQTSAPGATAAPQSVAAAVTTDSSFAGTASPGDVFTIAFNRVINTPDPRTVIRIQDSGGESVDLGGETGTGTNPTTFQRNPNPVTFQGKRYEANTVLTVTVGSGALIVDRDGNTSNNNNSIDYPATIVAQNGGITSTVQGQTNPVAWNPGTSSDNVLETGVAAPTAATGDTTAPVITPGTATRTATPATATFTSNEPLAPGSAAVGDVTFTDTSGSGATVSSVAVGGTNNQTITVTFTGTPGAGDTITLNQDSVTDVAGNTGPAADVTETF